MENKAYVQEGRNMEERHKVVGRRKVALNKTKCANKKSRGQPSYPFE